MGLEKALSTISSELFLCKMLEIALERIDNESFGVCKICEELIPEERMMEVLNATKCVACKEKEKLGLI